MNKDIYNNILALKRKLFPNNKLILFGSQARGDANINSDWDLLLLNKRKSNSLENKIFEFVKMGWQYGTHISIKSFTEAEWERGKKFPFYQNVQREGIEIK